MNVDAIKLQISLMIELWLMAKYGIVNIAKLKLSQGINLMRIGISITANG